MARIAHQAHQFRAERYRIAQQRFECEITGKQHAFKMVIDTGIVVERHAGCAACRFQLGQALIEQTRNVSWQRWRDR